MVGYALNESYHGAATLLDNSSSSESKSPPLPLKFFEDMKALSCHFLKNFDELTCSEEDQRRALIFSLYDDYALYEKLHELDLKILNEIKGTASLSLKNHYIKILEYILTLKQMHIMGLVL